MINHPNRSRKMTYAQIEELQSLVNAGWDGEPLDSERQAEWEEAENNWRMAVGAAVLMATATDRDDEAIEDNLSEASRIEDEWGSTYRTDAIAALLGFVRESGTHDYVLDEEA